MRTRVRRWLPLLCFAVVVVAAAIFVRLIQRGEAPASEADRAQVYSAWWEFGAAVVMTFLWAWSRWRKATGAEPVTATPDQVKKAAARLAEQTLQTWAQQAAVRGILTPNPVRVRWRWATSELGATRAELNQSRAIAVVPALLREQSTEVLGSGVVTRLHDEVYARLQHGRLVLTGGPGTGKTGAMLLLLLDALHHLRDLPPEPRARIPVPVWLTAGSWDPDQHGLRDWVIHSLQRDHPYLTAADFGPDASARLFDTGRIALFIDGLDELPAAHRPRAAQRLREESTGLRVVLTSQPDEYRATLQAGEQLPNTAVLEMRPVGVGPAVKYLLADRTPADADRWIPLTDHLTTQPGGNLAQALSTPLTLSLARAAYQHTDTDPGRLLEADLDTPQAVRGLLLDQALTSAYLDQKERDHARYWLGWLAHHMSTRPGGPTRDLPWWHIPTYLERRQRLLAALAAGLMFGVMWGLVLGLVVGLALGLVDGLVAGLIVGSGFGVAHGFAHGFVSTPEPRAFALRRPSRYEATAALRQATQVGFGITLIITVATVLVAWRATSSAGQPAFDLKVWLMSGCLFGFAVGFMSGLWVLMWDLPNIWGRPTAAAVDLTPRRTYQADRRYLLTVWGTAGVTGGLVFGVSSGLAFGIASGITFGTTSVLVGWLAFGGTGSAASLSFAQVGLWLTTRHGVRFMPLLEQALGRQVIRQVGTVYQFRHAELQDRLADHYQRENPDVTKLRGTQRHKPAERPSKDAKPRPTGPP